MTARAYYNEHDPRAAAWLRELIHVGAIAPGDVDERSIVDVRAGDLDGYTQCHFFAGIGGWSYALRLVGIPDDVAVWTGSCPCQPFSAAGRQRGFDDERHLWPEFHRLIAECRPAVVVGEQVASKAGRDWLAVVRSDLEREGYAVGAADLAAASVGAPHIRQRIYWGGVLADGVALAGSLGWERGEAPTSGHDDDRPASVGPEGEHGAGESVSYRGAAAGILADADGGIPRDGGLQRSGRYVQRAEDAVVGGGGSGPLAHDDRPGRGVLAQSRLRRAGVHDVDRRGARDAAPVDWSHADWLPCRDGKLRPVEPGTFPLAHGLPARVGRLRGYGNAIVPHVASAFVASFVEAVAAVAADVADAADVDPRRNDRLAVAARTAVPSDEATA